MNRLRQDLRDIATALDVADGIASTIRLENGHVLPQADCQDADRANAALAAIGWTIGPDSLNGASAGPWGFPRSSAHHRVRATGRIAAALERLAND